MRPLANRINAVSDGDGGSPENESDVVGDERVSVKEVSLLLVRF